MYAIRSYYVYRAIVSLSGERPPVITAPRIPCPLFAPYLERGRGNQYTDQTMNRIPVSPLLKDLARVFADAGHSVYLVGGAVRDMHLYRQVGDWDVATDAPPDRVMALFKRVIPTGIAHGTVTIHFKGESVECTTFRTEAGYSDGRRPDEVRYAATIEEDLSRRDFTMNAVAVSLPDGAVIDPFGGREDIRRGLIRTVGNPAERFAEDGLRPLRAVRFSAQLGVITSYSIHYTKLYDSLMNWTERAAEKPSKVRMSPRKLNPKRSPGST